MAVASTSAYSKVLEEMIVTVQKREQTMQDIPVAVSAFNGEDMVNMGVGDIRGLVDLTPGFNGKTEDSFIDALAIRGIVTNDFGIGGDPSVAIFVDNVWAGRNGGVQMAFYDMARAEVVKGPQSTLFGRNAIAGGINIVTNEPNELEEGAIAVTVDEHGYDANGMINVPLTDEWFFRAAAFTKDADGWLENVEGGDDLGANEVFSTRLGLKYAGEDVEAVFRMGYEDREQDASVYWTPINGLPEDKVATDLGSDGFDKSEIFSAQANVSWFINSDYTMLSVTGYKSYDFDYLEDYDGTSSKVNNYGQQQEVDYISQEFRLVYEGEGNITWFAGISAYQEDIDARFDYQYDEDALCAAISQTDSADFFGPATGCADQNFEDYWDEVTVQGTGSQISQADILSDKSEVFLDTLKSTGWSVYGDINMMFMDDRLGVTVGGRYTMDKKEMEIEILDSGGALGNNFGVEFYTDGAVKDDEEWSEFTPRLAVNFDATDDISVYYNWAKGYKTGGYSTFGVLNDGVDANGAAINPMPLSFDPEETTNNEIGMKSVLLDGSMQLNLAYFTYKYTDLQLIIFESGASLVKNLGEAETEGVEMDVNWAPGERWSIRAAAAWMDTEITEEIEAGDGSKGNKLQMAPDFSGSIITTYTVPVEKGEVYVTGTYIYQGEVFGGPGNFQSAKVDEWEQIDLRFGYRSYDEWSVTLWIENITNEEYFERGWENADEDNTGGYGVVNSLVWPNRPRTAGVTFDMKF
ncbi:TonB-dependent receptor [Dasania sp. GY-MA-18]|uniref:TonB-dependent receptor n=1 Tax=Dasania phycosphaerae TaxID=2950436 RepID=A0A9J6RLH9_9GAMM|nr:MULTISPECIES: TonB-dependent receptor [Dasania]MCR8922853.1 TonB-dependent receptor [Dasania sp. GY-MA-18]MCZ0865284.1 TonB-dependent receptor [Dasania phycosphaerae]MCZ0869009.1 TonB-dependent receptor [Dasania phycosphaerae]